MATVCQPCYVQRNDGCSKEMLLSAEKGTRRIAVEIKSFTGASDVNDLEQAIGQYVLYKQIMLQTEPDRELFLAVSKRVANNIFSVEIGQILLDGYVLLQAGWRGDDYLQGAVIHIQLIDSKIWVQYDGTEYGVANELVDAGIPTADIVLGFRHPSVRQYTGFAVVV